MIRSDWLEQSVSLGKMNGSSAFVGVSPMLRRVDYDSFSF